MTSACCTRRTWSRGPGRRTETILAIIGQQIVRQRRRRHYLREESFDRRRRYRRNAAYGEARALLLKRRENGKDRC